MYVFHGVDRAWNSAWNDELQDSISLRSIVSDRVNMAVKFSAQE